MDNGALKNIDFFNLYVGRIFAKLLSEFPLEINLSSQDIEPECDMYSKQEQMVKSTIKWLKNAGYITYDINPNLGGFLNVILTAKGLELLNSTPESVENKKTIAKELKRYYDLSRDEMVKELASKALSYGAKYCFGV